MKVSFEVTLPRWARLGVRYRKLKAAGVVIGAALVVAVPAAWASHVFADVTDAEPFHNQISAVAFAGITTGCNPGPPRLYCPEDNVTRKAMAAFMHRGFGRVGFVSAPAVGVPVTGTLGPLFGMPFTSGLPAGGLPGAAVFVKGDAEVTFTTDDLSGCPCGVVASLVLDGVFIDGNDFAYGVLSASNPILTIPVTGLGTVNTPGPKNVEVVGARIFGTGGNITANGNLTTSYFPFSSTGTNALALQPASKAERAERVAEIVETLTTGD